MSKINKKQEELLIEKIKKSKELDLKSLLKGCNEDPKYVPISGGNTLPVEAYKKAYATFNIETYRWFLIYQRYFTNLFEIENASDQEKQAWRQYLLTCYWYGAGCIVKADEKYYGMGVISEDIDFNGRIIKGSAYVNTFSFQGISNKVGVTKDFPEQNIVYGKWNLQGLPMLITLYDFIRDTQTLFTSFRANFIFNTKKRKYVIKNNNSKNIDLEIANANDPSKAYLTEINNGDMESSNKWEDMRTGESGNVSLLDQIKGYMSLFEKYLGITGSNTEWKRERNISDEFEKQDQFIKLQLNEIKTEMEFIINDANEKFGTNWKLKAEIIEDLEDDKDEQKEENNEKRDIIEVSKNESEER